MTWHYRGHFWAAITHDGGVKIEELMGLYLKPPPKPPKQLQSQDLRKLWISLKCGCTGSKTAVWWGPYFPPRWMMSPFCAIYTVTYDSCLSFPNFIMFGDSHWGPTLRQGDSVLVPGGRDRGMEVKAQGCGPCTCQLVCHRQAKITDWSIIWLKRAFHWRLFKKIQTEI